MKKFLLTLVLMVGIVLGLFAQKLTYQAVIRDNNQQLVTNTAMKATVTITFATGTPATYEETVVGSTNLHGLLSIEFGGDALNGRDFEGATITTTVKSADESTVYVDNLMRPVSAVPYALSVNGQSIQQYLTEHNYVDKAELDSRHYLRSDSTVITTMQGSLLQLSNKLDVQIAKMDSLAHLVDSLAKLPHGGGEVADGQPCPGAAKVTDYDNNEYNTVKIGNQCWMKENLKTTYYANGTPISYGGSYSSTTKAYRYYPNGNSGNVSTHGYLYNWKAVMGNSSSSSSNPSEVQGICPDGWHVPSDSEWTQLTTYVKSQPEYVCEGCSGSDGEWFIYCIDKALASTSGWPSSTSTCVVGNNPSDNNATGFSAVPAGCITNDNYLNFGKYAYLWSATKDGDEFAYSRGVYYDYGFVTRTNNLKSDCFSVRCLRDAGTGGGGTTPVPVEVSCEQVMECMGDTLGKLNTKIVDLNAIVTTQGQKIDSLAHVVDSLAKLPHGGGDTPTVEDTVFCYPNLGANTPETNKVTRGESFSLSTVTFTHPVETNWEIASWNTSADGSGTRYEKDATITPSGNITLYAQWHTFCTVSSVNSNEIGTTNRIDTLKDGENNKYTVVQISGQCWMKQNLRTSTINTGTIYTPAVGGYDVNTYGRLYDWTAVNVQDICPAGWHVPSNEEWTQLTNYVKGKSEYKCGSNIAKALASQTGWKDSSYDCAVGKDPSSNNATGFSAVPAGSTVSYGTGYDDFGKCAYFSSTTEKDDLNAYTSRLHVNSNSVTQDGSGKTYCKSVRCLRNTPAAPK